jgi:hypothetical protein
MSIDELNNNLIYWQNFSSSLSGDIAELLERKHNIEEIRRQLQSTVSLKTDDINSEVSGAQRDIIAAVNMNTENACIPLSYFIGRNEQTIGTDESLTLTDDSLIRELNSIEDMLGEMRTKLNSANQNISSYREQISSEQQRIHQEQAAQQQRERELQEEAARKQAAKEQAAREQAAQKRTAQAQEEKSFIDRLREGLKGWPF